MDRFTKSLRWTGLLSLVFVVFAFPVFAQCGDDCSSCPSKSACTSTQTCDDTAFANCEICRDIFKHMDLMVATDYDVADFTNGAVFTMHLKNPKLMDEYRTLEKKDKENCRKYANLSSEELDKKLCPFCSEYFKLRQRGLEEERISTPTGSLLVLNASDPALVKDLHTYTNQVRQMLASMDMSEIAGTSAKKSCSGDCGDCSGNCDDCTDCCGTCGGKAVAKGEHAHGHDEACCGTCDKTVVAKKELPPEMLEAFRKCALCKDFAEHTELMNMADMEVSYVKNGIVITNFVINPKDLEFYHSFNKKFHDKVEGMKKGSYDEFTSKICDWCQKFASLEHDGANMDWANINSGTLSVITANDEKLVARIHGIGKMMQQFKEM